MPTPKVIAATEDVNRGSDYTAEEFEFLKAMQRYQRLLNRRYPSWREALFVAHCLGYRKVAAEVPIPRKGEPQPQFTTPDTKIDESH